MRGSRARGDQLFNRRRRTPPSTLIAEPSNHTAAGTGTTDQVCCTKPEMPVVVVVCGPARPSLDAWLARPA